MLENKLFCMFAASPRGSPPPRPAKFLFAICKKQRGATKTQFDSFEFYLLLTQNWRAVWETTTALVAVTGTQSDNKLDCLSFPGINVELLFGASGCLVSGDRFGWAWDLGWLASRESIKGFACGLGPQFTAVLILRKAWVSCRPRLWSHPPNTAVSV